MRTHRRCFASLNMTETRASHAERSVLSSSSPGVVRRRRDDRPHRLHRVFSPPVEACLRGRVPDGPNLRHSSLTSTYRAKKSNAGFGLGGVRKQPASSPPPASPALEVIALLAGAHQVVLGMAAAAMPGNVMVDGEVLAEPRCLAVCRSRRISRAGQLDRGRGACWIARRMTEGDGRKSWATENEHFLVD